jgi:hypothetical protein
MTLVDTNVLLDLFTNDPEWAEWSIRQLDSAATRGPIAVNEVIYAELSIRFRAIEELDAALTKVNVRHDATPRPALFLAGKAFQRYRASGGTRTGVLPDFFIGAHAAISGMSLLSRDPRRYRTYFPTINLITP